MNNEKFMNCKRDANYKRNKIIKLKQILKQNKFIDIYEEFCHEEIDEILDHVKNYYYVFCFDRIDDKERILITDKFLTATNLAYKNSHKFSSIRLLDNEFNEVIIYEDQERFSKMLLLNSVS
jgi:hypothetical protein